LLERNFSIDEAKPFDQYQTQNLFDFVQKEHQPNAIYCKMMEHATCNTIECFSELIKIAQFYFSVMAHYADVERFFLDAATNLKEREIFLIEPVSTLIKLACNLNHLSCNCFHNIVKSDFTFLKKFKETAKYS